MGGDGGLGGAVVVGGGDMKGGIMFDKDFVGDMCRSKLPSGPMMDLKNVKN